MNYQNAQLKTSPRTSKETKLKAGVHELDLSHKGRDGLIYIPSSHKGPFPLVLMLHGAGGKAAHMLTTFQNLADHTGVVLLIPESRAQSWDVIHGGFGPDVAFIDSAFEKVFSLVSISTGQIGISGFSDGASYALSLGLANGNFFSHILAFSPGFLAPPEVHDSPPIFISHGTQDRVLNIDQCSRKLVTRLNKSGFEVFYREFKGEHIIPAEYAKEAFHWFLGAGSQTEVERSQVRVNPNLSKT